VKWSVNLQTLSSKKIRIAGDLVVDGTITNPSLTAQLAAALPKPATFRWNQWGPDYEQAQGAWSMQNNAALFAGVNPSNWSNSNFYAYQMSNSKPVLTSFFIHKAWAGPNAMVWSEVFRSYPDTTQGKHVSVLFRVKNKTASAIAWTPYYYYSSYGGWGEAASIALNGENIWTDTGNCYFNCARGQGLTIPANRNSTVIFMVGASPDWWNSSGYTRALQLGFYNDSLVLPSGLEFVDDLDTAKGGWEQ
ncbi:MAG: hypothetical protein ACOYOB_19525, partial [Myxococcota bacterium]